LRYADCMTDFINKVNLKCFKLLIFKIIVMNYQSIKRARLGRGKIPPGCRTASFNSITVQLKEDFKPKWMGHFDGFNAAIVRLKERILVEKKRKVHYFNSIMVRLIGNGKVPIRCRKTDFISARYWQVILTQITDDAKLRLNPFIPLQKQSLEKWRIGVKKIFERRIIPLMSFGRLTKYTSRSRRKTGEVLLSHFLFSAPIKQQGIFQFLG
jgi:hypothetical protein